MAFDTQPVGKDTPSEQVQILIEQWNLLLDAIDTLGGADTVLTLQGLIQTGGTYALAKLQQRPTGIPAAMSGRYPRR